ncbi:LOW QUALITY PROTEIN: hypothetical protein TorRG33x02_034510 [Trema orientale]|uniref:Uncharacterized protein n=1 Tax=Trema orientale TaxID=63057 RepID=A0A2P5FSR3_TREOI|nr:LOW QUALITY PROTEIN: hypothetical protein TorRG33x02_034510 [Trema orientale]
MVPETSAEEINLALGRIRRSESSVTAIA